MTPRIWLRLGLRVKVQARVVITSVPPCDLKSVKSEQGYLVLVAEELIITSNAWVLGTIKKTVFLLNYSSIE